MKITKKEALKNIPKGFYCYTIKKGKYINCPYWSKRKGRAEQESGYCSYLGEGDYERNRDKKIKYALIYYKGKKKIRDKPKTAEEIGLPMSLLFDQVKECGINEDKI